MSVRPLATLGLAIVPIAVLAGQGPSRTSAHITTTELMPGQLPFDASFADRLKVPAGFQVELWASGLGNVRMITVGPGGMVYATRRDSGDVIAFPVDANGRAGKMRKVVTDLPGVHGIAIDSGRVFLATVHEVYVAPIAKNGSIGTPRAIITDLPEGGQHSNRTLGIGPDRMLYISVGSTCNQCVETNPENATILRARPDGSERGVFARGLRNTVAWAWEPNTREMWGIDNGFDLHGDDIPPEEINHIVGGSHYGWPYCYADRHVDTVFDRAPPGSTKEEFCQRTIAAAMTVEPHGAPIQMVFYRGSMFPENMQGDAFATLRGSWNREPPSGYKVIRIHFRDGKPVAVDDFLTGFLADNGSHFIGRPAGLAVLPDGSLLVGDDTNGAIYRVTYHGTR